jgi:hypothetical protein
MNVEQFQQLLEQYPNAKLQFQLPQGGKIPAHFHVTEVGRIDKSFVDCGGTKRQTASCALQIWTADDTDHRLAASKLAGILTMAKPILKTFDLPLELEYGTDVAAMYSISHAETIFGDLTFVLAGKQTDCLAKEQCGINTCGPATGCC